MGRRLVRVDAHLLAGDFYYVSLFFLVFNARLTTAVPSHSPQKRFLYATHKTMRYFVCVLFGLLILNEIRNE